MRLHPDSHDFLEAKARQQLPAERDLERGIYSADDFLKYDLPRWVDYLLEAFDVLELVEVGGQIYRLLNVSDSATVHSFDILSKTDPDDFSVVVVVNLSIWGNHQPETPDTE